MSTEEPLSEKKQLRDSFGRIINNLRISVTDRCNFRCRYCMPEEMVWLKKSMLLSFEEIGRLVKIFSELGISKIRLTGGEPLMRKNLHLLVETIAKTTGIHDIGLTTNGYFLAEQIENLYAAGLRRINISLDSLESEKFHHITRRDYYGKVWEALSTVESLKIRPIKINIVPIRNVNDDEIVEFARLARERSFVVRFIEFMPIGMQDGWDKNKVVPTSEIIEIIERSIGQKLEPIKSQAEEPADRYRFADGIGELGFISSVSNPFCNHCNRIRITCDGKLRTCLFSLEESDLRKLLRGESHSDEDIKQMIVDAVWKKEAGHLINKPGFQRPERTMSQIGG